MEWMQSIEQSLHYMEENMENKLSMDDVAAHVFTSSAHFQRLFHLVTGYSIGEYIRNRRLCLAGIELSEKDSKIIDVALKYQYSTPESFAKAFYRFHGFYPSEVKSHPNQLKYFYPLTVHLTIQGGFDMMQRQIDEFYWHNADQEKQKTMSDKEKYQTIANWAVKARGQNPTVFDSLTEWLLDDSEWTEDKLKENEQILMHGILGRFREQNIQLRSCLKKLEPSGVVNPAVFKKLDLFDRGLSGYCEDEKLQDAVTNMFADFSSLSDRTVRKQIAGNKTGSDGINSVDLFGFINQLKEYDAQVQWTLFMPEEVERNQLGFRIESFEYKTLPAMRFLGFEGEEYTDVKKRMDKMKQLDALKEYQSEFNYDLFLMHFNGAGVDIGTWHGIFGRFMKVDTPIPDGFISIDFIPDFTLPAGAPFMSKFAFATFAGDVTAMHYDDGVNGDAIYVTTRNIILGQGGEIPYPDKYWTAEVFLDGCDKESTGYLFSADI